MQLQSDPKSFGNPFLLFLGWCRGIPPAAPGAGVCPSPLSVFVLVSNLLMEPLASQVFIKRGGVPIVSLECVSCKAKSVYEVSKSSYVYLEGTCQNCHNDSKVGVKSRGFASLLGGLWVKGRGVEREREVKSWT